jgi:hypothetical protein
MPITDRTIVAVEGALAAGKTTLVLALIAHYRSRGVHVACTSEPARSSPYFEEIVVHGRSDFDLACEVDLFAAQLADFAAGAPSPQPRLITVNLVIRVSTHVRAAKGSRRCARGFGGALSAPDQQGRPRDQRPVDFANTA